jgi:hypothetical protein
MPLTNGVFIVIRDRAKGIAVCIIAGIPFSYLMFLISLAVERESVALAFSEMRHVSLLEFAGTMSLVMLPSIMSVALANHVLGKLAKDSFARSTALGAVAAYLAFAVVCIILIREVPGWNAAGGIDTFGAAVMLLVTIPLSALYWLMTVRVERNRRKLANEGEMAIRVME